MKNNKKKKRTIRKETFSVARLAHKETQRHKKERKKGKKREKKGKKIRRETLSMARLAQEETQRHTKRREKKQKKDTFSMARFTIAFQASLWFLYLRIPK